MNQQISHENMPENVTSKVFRYEIKPKPGPIPPSKNGSFQHRHSDS